MKKIIAICMSILLVLMPLTCFAGTGFTQKDETVYAILSPDGTQGQVKIVNRLSGVAPGQVVDSGQYLSVRAMQQQLTADLNAGEVVWQLPNDIGSDFWYEGVIEKPLPIKVAVKWTKDGVETAASELLGVSGTIGLTISVSPNPDASKDIWDSYMTQVQFSISRPGVVLTDAGGAIVTAAGTMDMIAWSVLPGETASLSLSMDAAAFEISPIDLALIQYEMPSSRQLDDLGEGVGKLKDGAVELADGGKSLYTGTLDLNAGIAEFSTGLVDLSKGVKTYVAGMRKYDGGMTEYGAGLSQTTAALAGIRDGFVALQQQSALLLAGQQAQLDGLKQLAAGHAQLAQIAQMLVSDPNPLVVQLAGGVIAEKTSLDQMVAGMEQAIGGLSQFMTGLQQAIAGLDQLTTGAGGLTSGYTELQTGYRELVNGAVKLSAGTDKMAVGGETLQTETGDLPEGALKLADGQKELADGLTELSTELDVFLGAPQQPEPILSFADGTSTVHSVSFVLRIPGMTMEEIKKPDGPKDIRLPWYEELWKRLTGLFS